MIGKGNWKTIDMMCQSADKFEMRPSSAASSQVSFVCQIYPGGEVSNTNTHTSAKESLFRFSR